jgi:hypothetical protein
MLQNKISLYVENRKLSWGRVLQLRHNANELRLFKMYVYLQLQRWASSSNWQQAQTRARLPRSWPKYQGAMSFSSVSLFNQTLTQSYSNFSRQARIMRMMVGIGFVDETGFRTYKANKFTIAQSDPGFLGYILLTYVSLYNYAGLLRKMKENIS